MHASVRDYFIEFNEPIENRVPYMYLDIKGLVTIGIGNLFDVEQVRPGAGTVKEVHRTIFAAGDMVVQDRPDRRHARPCGHQNYRSGSSFAAEA